MKPLKLLLHRIFFHVSSFYAGMYSLMLLTYPLTYLYTDMDFSSILSILQIRIILIGIISYISTLYIYPMAFPKYNNTLNTIKIVSIIIYTLIATMLFIPHYPTREGLLKYYAGQLKKGKIELPLTAK